MVDEWLCVCVWKKIHTECGHISAQHIDHKKANTEKKKLNKREAWKLKLTQLHKWKTLSFVEIAAIFANERIRFIVIL